MLRDSLLISKKLNNEKMLLNGALPVNSLDHNNFNGDHVYKQYPGSRQRF